MTAAHFDVPERLAAGREAVEHTQIYVTACQRLGYQQPDLTGYTGQVRDWYAGEDGLDLPLLDADCAALWASVDAVEEALRVQCAQIGEVEAAWRGGGGESSAQFLRRHCDTGAELAAGLRAAAHACETLRDELWRLVGDKVAAAVDIDDRCRAQRPMWLSAAHAVTVGSDESRAAGEVIDEQIKPYVDTDIRLDWLNAMRLARSSVTAAYQAATAAATPPAGPVFAIPGELGPPCFPDEPPTRPAAPVVAAAPAPPQPGAAPADQVPAAPARVDSPLTAPLDDLAGFPAGGGLPGGFGAPGGAGGLGGLIPRVVDAIGGLLGSSGDGRADVLGDDGPLGGTPDESDPPDQSDDAEPVSDEVDEAGETTPEAPAEEAAADPPAGEAVGDQALPAGDPAAPTPGQPAGAEAKTPCEIAADELPQAGE